MKKNISFNLLILVALLLTPSLAHANEAGEFSKHLDKGWLWAYFISFGTGILTSLTPCVYPMIPITVAVFGSKEEGTTRKKAFALAACYVCGMGFLFAVLGSAFAMAGGQAGSLLSDPRVIIPLAILLVVLSTSLFGAFELRLPYSIQNKLNTVGGKGYGGAFGMGLVGGLVAAPCTGPFLAGMLLWVASTGSPFIGATLLFTYAMGVGVLFFVLAVTSMSIPKSGAWMDGIKSFGGIGLLGVAIHFLRPVFPQIDALGASLMTTLGSPTTLLIVGVVITLIGVILGSIHLSFHGNSSTKIRKGFGVLLTVVGITVMVSGILVPKQELPWRHDEQIAFTDAKTNEKGVMIDFGATWCPPCKTLAKTLGEPEVYAAVSKDFIPLKFDVSKETEQNIDRQNRYKAHSLPTLLFLDSKGVEVARLTGKKLDQKTVLEIIEKANLNKK